MSEPLTATLPDQRSVDITKLDKRLHRLVGRANTGSQRSHRSKSSANASAEP